MSNAPSAKKSKGLIDYLFYSWANNVWFGIAVLIAIFVYSSVGSAIPSLRQHPFFDLTEMGWFHWWPFDLMIALLVINMTTVTLKQIPFKLINAGVWTIHTGIIILCFGSVYYFGTKLEGDVPIFRRSVEISVPGKTEPVSLVVRPGNIVSTEGADGEYTFAVSQTFPEWVIASGDDAGKKAYMAWIDVKPPGRINYTRQLLDGYPEYTEDILPDRTRAKKTLGRQLVDDSVSMKLAYEPQTEFFLMHSASIFVRETESDRWDERPVYDMPHYNDHIGDHDDVIISPEQREPIPLRPINLEAPPKDGGTDALSDYDVRVTAYLRYASLIPKWSDGGDTLNPIIGISLTAGTARNTFELMALDDRRNTTANGLVTFKWVESRDAVDRLAASPVDLLTFKVPGTDIVLEVPITGPNDEYVPIAGTEFAYKIKYVVHDLAIPSGPNTGNAMSVAIVDIRTPDGEISRFVASEPTATRDVVGQGEMGDPSPAIDVQFIPGNTARITLIAGPEGVGNWVLFNEGSVIDKHEITVGDAMPVTPQINLTIDYLHSHGVDASKPMIVPKHQRQSSAKEFFSMVRLEISKDDWTESVWLPFNRYALPSNQYVVPRRIIFRPTDLRLPDGKTVQVCYSRNRHPLPAPIALETFDLATHPGGYTGSTITVSDFISKLRFGTDDGWSDEMQMSSNKPATHGGFWYFQSQWDPPGEGSAGMNYTGVGVGNRNGVYIQLFGTAVAVAGMIFAFYFKPIIRQKAQQKGRQRKEAVTESSIAQQAEPVGVA